MEFVIQPPEESRTEEKTREQLRIGFNISIFLLRNDDTVEEKNPGNANTCTLQDSLQLCQSPMESNKMSWLRERSFITFGRVHEKISSCRTRKNRKRFTQSVSAIECLEDRLLLTTTGIPWDISEPLTISFAPDETLIAGQQNEIFSTFDTVAETQDWQQEILRAFQTWSVAIMQDVDVVSDGGQDFGIGGFTQGDSRFGDFRIGAIPLDDSVLAISIPHDGFFSGTWAGDIIFNSHADFQNLNDIFSVALHESGHIWGLDHNSDPISPMNAHNRPGISAIPTFSDLTELKSFYGNRHDDLEESDLEESDQSDLIEREQVDEFSGEEAFLEDSFVEGLNRFAEVSTEEEVLTTDSVATEMTTAQQIAETTLSEQVATDLLGTHGATSGIGDLLANDPIDSVTDLSTTFDSENVTRYRADGSISDTTDIGFYRVISPTFVGGEAPVMTVSILSPEVDGLTPKVSIFDQNGVQISSVVLTNEFGQLSVQAVGLAASQTYLVKVAWFANRTLFSGGNYNLDVLFTASQAKIEQFSSGTLNEIQNTEFYRLDNRETQLFHLALQVESTPQTNPRTAVQLTIFDASGIPLFRMVATPDQVHTTDGMLLPVGVYTIRINATTADGSPVGEVNYSLSGKGTSKPTGPLLSDPTLSPVVRCSSDPSGICYPNVWTNTTGNHQVIVEAPALLDPWNWNPNIGFLNTPTSSPWYWFRGI